MNYEIRNMRKFNEILKESSKLNEISIDILKENMESNMQNDIACFESWVFILKCKYPSLKINLILREYDFNIKNIGHVNRFKYRLMKFIELYPNLLNNVNDIERYIRDFKESFYRYNLTINVPLNIPKEATNYGEVYIEKKIIEQFEEIFCDYNMDVYDRQLPVGLFKESVSKRNSIFTYGHSAIDFWAIKEAEFYLFELKKNNKMIGVITELLFYANFMHEVFYNNKLQIKFDENCRNINEVRKLKDSKQSILIKPYFFIDNFHKLIEDNYANLLKLINSNELYEFKTIKYIIENEKIKIEEYFYEKDIKE